MVVAEKREVIENRATKPLRKQVNTSFSIKNIAKEDQVNPIEEVLRDDLPKDAFCKEDVLNSWDNFLTILKKKNIPVYNALSSTSIKMEGTNIIFSFASTSSATEFENYKMKILDTLRERLNNYYFELKSEISEQEEKGYILSKKEKFAILANKNSLVLRLKKEFGLDLFD